VITRPNYAIDRAIRIGIEDARCRGKDAPEPYNMKHPAFMFWWCALVTKYDHRDWSDQRVRAKVLGETKWRGVG
jgi:hypothetical protein